MKLHLMAIMCPTTFLNIASDGYIVVTIHLVWVNHNYRKSQIE